MSLELLTELALGVGSSPISTPGAGGNVAWKESRTMFVKSTGTRLRDAAPNLDFFSQIDLISGELALGSPRASIEASLHAYCPFSWTAHTHDELLQAALLIDPTGRLALSAAPPEWAPTLVPYARPGTELAAAFGATGASQCAFMLCHGLFVGGQDPFKIIHEIERFRENLAKRLGTQGPVPEWQAASPRQRAAWASRIWAVNPDFVLFAGSEFNPQLTPSTQDEIENLNAYAAISTILDRAGVDAVSGGLSSAEAAQIRSMEQEKLRLKMSQERSKSE